MVFAGAWDLRPEMKRGLKWSDEEDEDASSSDDSSTPNTDSEDSTKRDASLSSKQLKASQVSTKKKKGIDFEALSQHGYKGGLSVLSVPPPKEPENELDWKWSTGKDKQPIDAEESFKERQKTRAALADGEELVHVQTRREKEKEKEKEKEREKKNLSFQQKEKRKRDLGQASRGKNYVEEEKRLLRDSGVYSGFDS